MKVKLLFKTICKCLLNCSAVLFFLLFVNQAFGQVTRPVQAGYGIDMGDCTSGMPCATINYAIEQSNSGDIIEVYGGTYTEAIIIDKSLTINGADQATTIIQAAEAPGIAGVRVITVEGDNIDININNLTIRYGHIIGLYGGGLSATSFNSLAITNVTFYQNQALDGAGLFSEGNPVLSNVMFIENTTIEYEGNRGTGGGMFNSYGSPILTHVTFSNNSAHGGAGLLNIGGSPVLTDCYFNNNFADVYGGGMSAQQSTSATLTDVSFVENQAIDGAGIHNFYNGSSQIYKNVTFTNNIATQYGGGLYSDFSINPQLVNVVFSGNSAEKGGAIGLLGSMSPLFLINATISNNNATSQGGGIYSNYSSDFLNVSNSIIWNNTSGEEQGNEIYKTSGTTNISYSIYKNDSNDIVGTINPSNSLTEDPMFMDVDNGDFQLINDSPGINAGNPSTDISLFPGGSSNPLDLANNPRVIDVIDIGSYENQETLTIDEHSISILNFYPNPVSSILNIVSNQEVKTITIYNMLGQQVILSSTEHLNKMSQIDVSSLDVGIYLIEVANDSYKETFKIIKK